MSVLRAVLSVCLQAIMLGFFGIQRVEAQSLDRDSLATALMLKLQKGDYAYVQNTLLKNLETPGIAPEDKVFDLMFLAYTYKTVLDYPSVLRFLSEAEKEAEKVANRDSVRSVILTEKAFVYFDREQYDRADSVQQLVKLEYIEEYGRAILLIQSGHQFQRKGNFAAAENSYMEAGNLMKAAYRCDLPLVYVKQMTLYAVMNEPAKRDSAFASAWHYAVDCHIIKHQLFAVQEYSKLLKTNKEFELAEVHQHTYDSLRVVFDAEEHAMQLTKQREEHMLEQKNTELSEEQEMKRNLLRGAGVLAFLIALLTFLLLRNRRKKKALDDELNGIREELKEYVRLLAESQAKHPEQKGMANEPLSSRQQEVLDLLTKGLSNKEIATALFISENTVKFHIKGIYQTLGIKDRKELLSQDLKAD